VEASLTEYLLDQVRPRERNVNLKEERKKEQKENQKRNLNNLSF